MFDIDWQLAGTPEVAPPLVAHTGSIAAVLEPGCRATAALLDAYHPSATITFDPNVRPALIDDDDRRAAASTDWSNAATWSRPATRTCAGSTRTAPPSRSRRRGWRLGPSIVAVTMGERGAFAMCAAGTVRVQARPVDVVDTVGAGDAFMTGLIDALWSLGLLGADRRADLARISVDALTGVRADGGAVVGADGRPRRRRPARSRRPGRRGGRLGEAAPTRLAGTPYWVMRSIWKGSIAFGLVNVPVKVYSATEDHDIKFHQVHAKDNGRIRYKRVCEVCGEVVEYRDIATAYESDDGQTVVITDEDIATLPEERSREIEVLEFVPAERHRPDDVRPELLPGARRQSRRSPMCCWPRR